MDGETEGKAKLTAAWQAAVARMIEAGYNPADVHETMISVGLSGTRRSRISYMLLVGIGIVGVSALLLFSDLISSDPSAIWRTLSRSRNHNSEEQRDKAPLETRQALVRAHREMETLNGDRARLLTDLTRTAEEIEALKLEGARALAGSGEAVRAAEAKGAEQISQDQTSSELEPQRTISSGLKTDFTATVSTLSQTSPEQALLARANSLLKDRDISGARLVLERALQAGSSRAAFQLAETYDPRQLTRWRAHGVRGDWAKAEALYLRAHNDGIMEAKERIATIR